MPSNPPTFFFDYVDPLSYLMHLEVENVRQESFAPPLGLRRVPLELRPPPLPLLDPDGPPWATRWGAATVEAPRIGVTLAAAPQFLPWTRKAHELALLAQERGIGDAAHRALFEAVFVRGDDVGRVDVLVAIGERLGLPGGAVKVALDVDHFAAGVEAARRVAADAGVTCPPALAVGGRLLQGFHNHDAMRTFLLL